MVSEHSEEDNDLQMKEGSQCWAVNLLGKSLCFPMIFELISGYTNVSWYFTIFYPIFKVGILPLCFMVEALDLMVFDGQSPSKSLDVWPPWIKALERDPGIIHGNAAACLPQLPYQALVFVVVWNQ